LPEDASPSSEVSHWQLRITIRLMTDEADGARVMPIPDGLAAAGTDSGVWRPLGSADEQPPGSLRRFTFGDADLLLAHTVSGLCLTDDRCPHMSAPLSIGTLDDCVVACPLHKGRFDLSTGETVQFPTTGGLDADGNYHPTWSVADAEPKPEPADLKAQARALTRIRRLRYYPLRIRDGIIEARLPT
jgi:nitrite reductase/ring-hydroxylating ferredoxin subunit